MYDGEDQHQQFIKLGKKLGLNNEKYVLRARYLPQEKDFGITISNRGGMLANAEYKIDPLKSKLNKKCFYPSYKFFLDYNGDVLMCSHDWGKKYFRKFKKSKVSRYLVIAKNSIIKKPVNFWDRSLSPCDVCDVHGDLIGKNIMSLEKLQCLKWKIKNILIINSSDIGLSVMKIYKK